MEENNYNYIRSYINKNFSEIGNIEENEFDTIKKRLSVVIQCIKSYLNKEYDVNMGINGTYTKTLYSIISTKMNIDFIENSSNDMRVYFLQMVLICRGYSCDLNGQYTSTTMKAFKKYKADNKLKNISKYPYEVSSTVWYKLLTNKEEN